MRSRSFWPGERVSSGSCFPLAPVCRRVSGEAGIRDARSGGHGYTAVVSNLCLSLTDEIPERPAHAGSGEAVLLRPGNDLISAKKVCRAEQLDQVIGNSSDLF